MNKIIKKFKGGSLSSTVLMESYNGQFFVRKSVSLKENREYGFQRWYSQLKRIQRYSVLFPGLFPKLINFGKDKNQAYMDIEYFNNAINAQEYIKSCKNKKDIDIFFDLLMKSINKMHKVKIDSSNNAIDLYLNEEVDQKLKDCLADKKFSIFLKYDMIIFNGKKVKSFLHVLDKYKKMCLAHYAENMETFTHGNITLENILYIPQEERVVFIDPYEENIVDSVLAEYSQLLQSSNAQYERYNSKNSIVHNNNIELNLPRSFGLEHFNNRLVGYLNENFSTNDYIMIKLFEVSQFVRMLPFKLAVDKNKMIFFYGLASYLFHMLEENNNIKKDIK